MQDKPRLHLRTVVEGQERRVPLAVRDVRIGRGLENELVLPDFSVSRNHALVTRDGERWLIRDLASTNGLKLNGRTVEEAPLGAGDRVAVGIFELTVEGLAAAQPPALPPAQPVGQTGGQTRGPATPLPTSLKTLEEELGSATLVRPIATISAEFGLVEGSAAVGSGLDPAQARRVVGYLTRLASALLAAGTVDEVLERVMDLAFEALPVERGFILLRDEDGEIRCELAREKERKQVRPTGQVPVSRTILDTVIQQRVAILTHDAQSDHRFAAGESIRIHSIRAALCVPFWSAQDILGVLQVDSPLYAGSLDRDDLDFLTAVANYGAVAVERLRNAERVKVEQELRSRLERYHSPAVLEEVVRRGEGAPLGRLRPAEVTVLFADLVGFTALSERLPPGEVARLLDIFFTGAVEAVFAAGGTLDKFIGDCIMAFFGAPIAQVDHAQRAVAAAIGMREALARGNTERLAQGLEPLECRIALNSGPVVVGDVGSARRVDYTVLGNTVNVAARLEQGVARPGDIVLGQETHRLLAGAVAAEPLGELRLRGLQRTSTAARLLA